MPSYLQILVAAGPEAIIAFSALLVLTADVAFMRDHPTRERFLVAGVVSGFGCLASLFYLVMAPQHLSLFDGLFISDPLTSILKMSLVVLGLLTVVVSFNSTFTDHVGEYVTLVLLATLGFMFMVSSHNLLLIFTSLELASLSLYILTAFNKSSPKSTEAALKYFLVGGVSAAFTLFGLSWVYGLTGSLDLKGVSIALKGQGIDPMLLTALIMTVMGFGFKVAAVPFHLWAPDAYEGAPAPSAALIASGSKVASFIVLMKIVILGFPASSGNAGWRTLAPGWMPLLALLSIFSVLLGNLAALAQNSLRRILAYSAVAHTGYVLLGVLSGTPFGLASISYYSITYGLTSVGLFAIVHALEEAGIPATLDGLTGLSRKSPLLAWSLMILLLSLAGIPPLAGFFGKFYLFAAALKADPANLGLLWLVIFAIAMSAVSLYYYLVVLKHVFVIEESADGSTVASISNPLSIQLSVGLIATAVVVFGAVPDLLVGPISAALKLAGF